MPGTRKVIDCRLFPTGNNCTLAISGSEEEVLDLAVLHATTVHGHENKPELREQIRSLLTDEPEARAATA
jgi:predicted small metal-binding protein